MNRISTARQSLAFSLSRGGSARGWQGARKWPENFSAVTRLALDTWSQPKTQAECSGTLCTLGKVPFAGSFQQARGVLNCSNPLQGALLTPRAPQCVCAHPDHPSAGLYPRESLTLEVLCSQLVQLTVRVAEQGRLDWDLRSTGMKQGCGSH